MRFTEYFNVSYDSFISPGVPCLGGLCEYIMSVHAISIHIQFIKSTFLITEDFNIP